MTMSPLRASASAGFLKADLLVVNARVHTLDPARPVAEAVAVVGNRIGAVGTTMELRGLAGETTQVIDAGGQLLLPGFNDAHVHFLEGGFQLHRIELRETATPADFAERLGRHAATLPAGRWITGGNWDHERWPGASLPTRGLIDPVTPHHPVLIRRLDGHMALANSAALAIAGINRTTSEPPGGQITKDPGTGEPTGLLKDAAIDLVGKHIPEPSFEEKLAAARAASRHAASLGVTSVQDVSANEDLGVYQELRRRGELVTRIYAFWPLPRVQQLAAVGFRAGFGDPWLRCGALKAFSDGSLGSTTAWFFAPYLDAPDTRGLPAEEMFTEGAMRERILAATRAGLQVAVHAIGDRANHEVLSLFEATAREDPGGEPRFRIEHAQHVRPQDLPRFAQARVIASMQPYHCADDARWAEKRIGRERCETTYAFRALLDAGVTLAFGSDWTVAPLNPLLGLAAAVTRQSLDGKHPEGWVPAQKIRREEALRAYTIGSAFAEFQEHEKGSIRPGKLADLVLIDRDLFQIPPATFPDARVVLTIVDGRVVYDARSDARATPNPERPAGVSSW